MEVNAYTNVLIHLMAVTGMFISMNVHPMVGVQFLMTVRKASPAQWQVSASSYSWSVTSSIVVPSSDSVLPMTILPMDAAIVSRYTDPVESSRMILLVLMLEMQGVILQTADTPVGVLPSGHVGSVGCILVMVSTKPWAGIEDHLTASVLGGWKCWYGGSSW